MRVMRAALVAAASALACACGGSRLGTKLLLGKLAQQLVHIVASIALGA